MYRFMLWLVPTVEKFPRSQKFLLGDRVQGTALDVLERLIGVTDGWRAQIASRVCHDEESAAPASR